MILLLSIVLATHKITLIVPQMHSIALAVQPHIALCAFPSLHPFFVPIYTKLIGPYISKLLGIDIALVILTTYAETTGDGAVGQYGGHVDSGLAKEWMIPNLPFVISKKAFATVTQKNTPFLTDIYNKVHKLTELCTRQLQIRIVGCPSHRYDGKNAPFLYP